jgi:hypothetical protein
MNTDVFARDGVAGFVRVDVWFVAALGIRVWWEAAGVWASFFNHGWTRINTDVFAMDGVARFICVERCSSVVCAFAQNSCLMRSGKWVG